MLARAVADGRVLVTRNFGDFLELHGASPAHRGGHAVYHDDDPAKDLSYGEIADAVGRGEASTLPTEGQFLALNAWPTPRGAGSTRIRRRARG